MTVIRPWGRKAIRIPFKGVVNDVIGGGEDCRAAKLKEVVANLNPHGLEGPTAFYRPHQTSFDLRRRSMNSRAELVMKVSIPRISSDHLTDMRARKVIHGHAAALGGCRADSQNLQI